MHPAAVNQRVAIAQKSISEKLILIAKELGIPETDFEQLVQPQLVRDPGLRLLRTTESYEKVINLIAQKVGAKEPEQSFEVTAETPRRGRPPKVGE